MKKLPMTLAVVMLLGLLFSAANVSANPTTESKPRQTPGAKATEKAGQRATEGHAGQGNGQGSNNTPGAKATEKAGEHATKGTGKPKGRRVTYRGTVTAVGADSLTLSLAGGGSKTFAVTASTRIRIPTLGRDATLADVHTGVRALVQVLKDDSSLAALFINVVPGKPAPVHRVGIVTAYTPGASITVQDSKGDSSTFLITPETKILPKDRANRLGIGSRVTIISRRDVTGGPLTAQGIVVHPQAATEPAATETSAATATPTAADTSTPTSTPTPTETPTPTATP